MQLIRETAQKIHPGQLSMSGRVMLLGSLVLSKASYYMDLISLHKLDIKNLEKIYFKTLWDGKERSPVDRRICQLPWDAGGIGAKDIELWSRCKAAMWIKKLKENSIDL